MEPRNFLRVGEGLEARRKAGKRAELPRVVHYGTGSRSRGGGGGGSAGRRAKGVTGMEVELQLLPARCVVPENNTRAVRAVCVC